MSCTWAELPKEILEQIVYRMGAYADYLRIRAVCKSWRSMLPRRPSDHHHQLLPRQLPWLVLQSLENRKDDYDHHSQLCHGFFSFSEKKIHRLLDSICSGNGLHLIGSSHGWLVTVEEIHLSVSLLNPITGHQMILPPLTTFPNYVSYSPHPYRPDEFFHQIKRRHRYKYLTAKEMSFRFMRKVILTSSPITTNTTAKKFMIIAILYTNCLALFKPEGGKWILIDLAPRVGRIKDIAHFNGQIYVVDYHGGVYAYDVDSSEVRIIIQRRQHKNHYVNKRFYLVELCGELLLVIRRFQPAPDTFRNYGCSTSGFEVFMVDESKGDLVEVKSLGNHALFLGGRTGSSFSFPVDDHTLFLGGRTGSSFSFPVDDHALLLGGRTGISLFFLEDDLNVGEITRNCIYFVSHHNPRGDCTNRGREFGVFHLEDGSIRSIPFLQIPDEIWPLPLWIIPDP